MTLGHVAIFFGLWFVFAAITNESHIPSGFLVPGIICGSAIGSMYNEIRLGTFGWGDDNEYTLESSACVFLGAGAFLASFVPLNYSLCILILECTNSFQIIIPLIAAMQTSRTFAKFIVDYGIYDRGLRIKNIPLLRESPPDAVRSLHAFDIMSKNVLTVPSVADMPSLKKAMDSDFIQFPVLNTAGHMVGLVNKWCIKCLLQNKMYYDQSLITVPTDNEAGEIADTNINSNEDDKALEELENVNY